ncbi:hypothetical protein KW790_00730 [Candidatus Parcubacteria bacterium]|nr:hypothetical protein [Candidatus Parcubacteria bacterium]
MNNPFLTSEGEVKFFGVLGVILIGLLALSFVLSHRVKRQAVSVPTQVVSAFDHITLEAKAAYVYDVRTGNTLFAKEENERLPLASITKVMTALVARDLAPSGTTVTITQDAILADGDSGLHVGERWTLKDLLDFSLTSSSNDGMRAVALTLGSLDNPTSEPEAARQEFIRLMNKKAEELNLDNTYYFNETGLDESFHRSGAYGTARDMSVLFAYVLRTHPDLFEATRLPYITTPTLDHTVHTAKNTDVIVNEIPGLRASKTGSTDLAGGNLVIAFDPEIGRPIVISVLGSTDEARFQDVQKLVKAALETIQSSSISTTTQVQN